MSEENGNSWNDQDDEDFGEQERQNFNKNIEDSILTEETIIFNEGAEDDYLSSNLQKKRINQNKANREQEKKQSIDQMKKTHKLNNPPKKQSKAAQHSKVDRENKIQANQPIKTSKKKVQPSPPLMEEEKKEKYNNEESNTTDELFKKAIEKNSNKGFSSIELDNEGNTLSTKVTEVLYDKFVGQNIQKSKHLDIYSKIKDEEIRQGREATRTKDDAKKINDMIVRQEDYEKLKSDKKKDRQREIKNKINEECVFIPNGKKNVSTRTASDFYNDQKKFIEKKDEIIHKLTQNMLDTETKNSKVTLISKNSERIANSKNTKESLTEFCQRLAKEKLKNIREILEAPKEERKLTKKELKLKS